MAEPPLGSATPRDRGFFRGGGIPVKVVNKPMITVDPQAADHIKRITEAVASLKREFKDLATAAERFQKVGGYQAGGVGPSTRPGFRPGVGGSQWAGASTTFGGRPGAGGVGGGGGGGGTGPGAVAAARTGFIEAEIAQTLLRSVLGQVQNTMAAGQVTNRLGIMNQPTQGLGGQGATFQGIGMRGGGTGAQYQAMLRQAGGTSSQDIYGGGALLGRIGAITSPTDPRSRGMAAQAVMLGRISGTGMAGGAAMMQNLMAPGVVQALRSQADITVAPGGVMNAPSDIFEQLYKRETGGTQDKKLAGRMFQTGQAEGTYTRKGLEGMGLSPETIDTFMAWGAMRAEKGTPLTPKDIDKNVSNAAESMRKFEASMTRLKDSLSTTLIPAFTALANIVTPIVTFIGKFTENLTNAQKALVALALAAATASLAVGYRAAGGMSGIAGTVGGSVTRGVGGVLGSEALGGAGAAVGGLGVAASLGAGLLGGLGGSWVGRQAAGALGAKQGAGRKVGSVLGGAAGGAVLGATIGSIVPGAGTVAGGLIGGAVGGIVGAFGDPVTRAWSGYNSVSLHGLGDGFPSDSDLLAHPPSPSTTPGGGPLPGPGNSTNLNPSFITHLKEMFAANPKLSVTSGWRSHEEQAFLRWKHLTGLKPEPVAPVGTSRHESGNAADIGPPSEYKWLADNAPGFGLKATVGGEPWHWELIGGAASGWQPPPSAPSAKKVVGKAKSTKAVGARAAGTVAIPHRAVTVGTNEADWIANILSSSYAAGGGGGSGGDTGDAVFVPAGGFRSGSTQGPPNQIIIHNLTLKVEIAKGTPDEAERAARYLMEILGDRERLQALANQ